MSCSSLFVTWKFPEDWCPSCTNDIVDRASILTLPLILIFMHNDLLIRPDDIVRFRCIHATRIKPSSYYKYLFRSFLLLLLLTADARTTNIFLCYRRTALSIVRSYYVVLRIDHCLIIMFLFRF